MSTYWLRCRTIRWATGMLRNEFCSNRKSRPGVMIRKALIVIGHGNGIGSREIADVLDVDPSVSKDAARGRVDASGQMTELLKAIRFGR